VKISTGRGEKNPETWRKTTILIAPFSARSDTNVPRGTFGNATGARNQNQYRSRRSANLSPVSGATSILESHNFPVRGNRDVQRWQLSQMFHVEHFAFSPPFTPRLPLKLGLAPSPNGRVLAALETRRSRPRLFAA